MPTLPDPKTQSWKGIFQGTYFGDFIRAQNLDLEKKPGRLLLADRVKITCDSTDGGLSSLGVPISFLNSSVDGTQKFWTVTSTGMFLTSSVSSDVFASDTTTGTPSVNLTDMMDFTDSSAVIHLLVSNSVRIYELNRSAPTRWVPDYPYSINSSLTWTGSLSAGATSATLSASWSSPTGMYQIVFSNNDVRMALFTNGSTTVAWVPAGGLSGGAAANFQVAINKGIGNFFAFTTSVSGGDTSKTLTATWSKPTGNYLVQFSDGEIRTALFTNGSLTVSWTPAVAGNSTGAIVVGIHGTIYLGSLSNLIIIAAGSTVSTVDVNNVYTDSRLTLDANYAMKGVYTGTDRAWMMAQGVRGDGVIYEWDGGSDTVNASHYIDGYPLLGFLVNDIPYFVLQDGRIVASNTKAFVDVAFFPNYEEKTLLSTSVSQHGAQVDGDLVYINLVAPLNSFRMRSGTWVFNSKNYNLYPMFSWGQYKGSSNLDFGQAIVGAAGGILFDKPRTNWLIGAQIYTAYSNTTKNTISTVSINDSNGNRGYFITAMISSLKVEDFFYNLWLRFPKLVSNLNKINVKYRVAEDLITSAFNPIQLSITWVDTTHFTAVLPTGIANGNEVEVLAGDNAGCVFHISSMSAVPDGVTTITVTIDEAAPVSSTKVALAEFNNWVKITTNNPITSQTLRTQYLTTGNAAVASGPYVQFKIELRGILTGIDQLTTDSDTQTDEKL